MSFFERPSFICPSVVEQAVPNGAVELPEKSSWERYAQLFRRRDLFAPVEARSNADIQEAPDFRVAGVMLGARKSVVLEDVRREKVLFLAEGEAQGDFLVKAVGEEHVILEVSGELIEVPMKGAL